MEELDSEIPSLMPLVFLENIKKIQARNVRVQKSLPNRHLVV
jgi:hypothetical protein